MYVLIYLQSRQQVLNSALFQAQNKLIHLPQICNIINDWLRKYTTQRRLRRRNGSSKHSVGVAHEEWITSIFDLVDTVIFFYGSTA